MGQKNKNQLALKWDIKLWKEMEEN
jgi:hypothetical protein